jgi:hypothetical protein
MAYSHKQIAERYGVSRGAVQGWEKRGLNREWNWQKIEEWRAIHAAGRVVIPPTKPATAEPQPTTPAAKPSAEAVISQAAGFQETRTAKLRKEIERLDLIIKREKGELVLADEMRETATRVVAVWCSELDALVGDLPGQLAGLTEAEIQPKLRSRIELLKANAREGFAAL